MLIDKTYFIGPLTIAQLGQPAVEDDLNNFIALWEPKIMTAALGYDFYQDFIDGISSGSDEVIEQRWLDLLNGVMFTNVSGIKRKWVGFAGGDNIQSVISAQRENLTIYAGLTTGFPEGGFTYSNAGLQTWNFDLEIFGAGTLERGVDWNYKSGGGIVLTDINYQTNFEERWILHFTGKKVQNIQSGNQNLLSPLAGFIFYEYMVNLSTQNTGIGVVKSASENSMTAIPARKLADAYNQAVRDMWIFDEFMQTKTQATPNVYPEYDLQQINYYGFKYYSNYMNPLF